MTCDRKRSTVPGKSWAGLQVLRCAEDDEDIFYTDESCLRNHECLSTGCLFEPVLAGRTPLQVRTLRAAMS
jgi:hypothetical protein